MSDYIDTYMYLDRYSIHRISLEHLTTPTHRKRRRRIHLFSLGSLHCTARNQYRTVLVPPRHANLIAGKGIKDQKSKILYTLNYLEAGEGRVEADLPTVILSNR